MKFTLKAFIILSATLFTGHAAAFSISAIGKVTYIENGWFGEGVAIHMSSGTAGCPAGDTDYAVEASHPAYKEIVALATSAFVAAINVEIVTATGSCAFGDRNKILSIRLIKG
ncbi:MAG: hypothetical protein ACI8WB_001601 [Phenylobacterium sp.]|jgi:hypothetical protein